MIEMIHGDCMEIMKQYPDKYFDLSCVDPPYGIDIGSSKGFYHVKGVGQANPHKQKDWDKGIPSSEYFVELNRVSKNQIIWGGNYFTKYLPPSRCWVFWDKVKYVDNYADGEMAWTSFDANTKILRHQHHGFLNSDGVSIHPTQKPVALYKWLLSRYAKPGDKILDTHGGSGSICIACHDLGYDLTWMELDEDYYKAACERYKNHAKQINLFEPAEIRQPVQGELL